MLGAEAAAIWSRSCSEAQKVGKERVMFVVCGEALMDVFGGADTPGGVMLDARIGGSPLNVAIGLARLAQPVAFFGALSTGFLGQRLMRALRDEGVALDCVARVDAPTTLGLVGVDEAGVASYSFYGHGAADRLLPLQALAALPAAARAFHFGSYAMVVDPVAATQRALVEREHQRSLIAYDPNIRLNVEPDLGRWHDTLQWMLPRTHLLKVSDEDLGLLYPGCDAAALAGEWVARGVAWVVVTRGAHGAEAFSSHGTLAIAPVPSAVVDTVGAGDTFQAAMLVALAERGAAASDALRQLSLAGMKDVLDFAARAAAITCSRRGADMPRRIELV
jgi:fructokinase